MLLFYFVHVPENDSSLILLFQIRLKDPNIKKLTVETNLVVTSLVVIGQSQHYIFETSLVVIKTPQLVNYWSSNPTYKQLDPHRSSVPPRVIIFI